MAAEDPIITLQGTAPPLDPQAELYKALAEAQAQAGNVVRNKTANAGARTYHYASLDVLRDAVRPIMAKHGLTFFGRMSDGGIMWLLSHVAGGVVEWYTPYPDGATTPQGLGSCVTYMTRYQLALVLGVASEDDDDAQTAQEEAQAAQSAQSAQAAQSARSHQSARSPQSAARPAPMPPGNAAAARDAAMQDFWRVWSKADLPSWKGEKDRARAACDEIITRVLGARKFLSKLSVAELERVNAAIAAMAPQEPSLDIPPPDPDDPFAGV